MAPSDEPRSDAEIAAYTVGPPDVLNSTITLVDYDPDWPQLYERERERISRALGDRALLLEHVGSTAIPGLAAKPRIDVCLAVAEFSRRR